MLTNWFLRSNGDMFNKCLCAVPLQVQTVTNNFNHSKQEVCLQTRFHEHFSGDLKSELFEGLIYNSAVFKWSGFSYGHSPTSQPFENQTIQNTDVFLQISNGLIKWRPFVRNSNIQSSTKSNIP